MAPGRSRLRTWAAATAGALAVVVLPLAMVAAWTAGVVTDTDRYVATVGPLADDPVVQRAVERRLTAAVLARLELRATSLEADLVDARPVVRRLVRAVLDLGEREAPALVEATVRRFVEDHLFAEAWSEANRTAHAELVAVLTEGGGAGDDRTVSITLATVLNAVVDELAALGFEPAATAPTVDASFTLVEGADLARAARAYRLVDRLGVALPVLWLVLVAATLVLARDRRRAVLRLGGGALAVLAALAVALRVARGQVVGSLPPVDAEVVEQMWRVVLARLRTGLQAGAVVALAAILVAWMAGPSGPATTLRGWAARGPAAVRGSSASAVALPAMATLLVLVLLVWVI